MSLWYCADSQPLSCHPPGCLTCGLAVGLCHPSCYTSVWRLKGSIPVWMQSDTHKVCCFSACSSVSAVSVSFWILFSMLKHLNPGQVHQPIDFTVVSVHGREAERHQTSTGLVVHVVTVRAHAGRGRTARVRLNIGLVFGRFLLLGVYSSPLQLKHLISLCHQKMFHHVLPHSHLQTSSNFQHQICFHRTVSQAWSR